MSRTLIRFLNNVLATVILILALFIVLSPFLPELQLEIAQKIAPSSDEHYLDQPTKNEPAIPPPEDNTLVIPAIDVHGIIHEGNDVNTLNLGIWHRPKSSTPDKGSNTVLVAHRYLYTSGPDTFYHLPKMTIGQRFVVFWGKKKYTYEVFKIETVNPDTIEVEAPTKETVMTLYTCTPLWTSEHRFVVKAKLII